jgi:farnesyl diphosphate synthase
MTLAALDMCAWLAQGQAQVEQALDDWVSLRATTAPDHQAPADLMEAMRYAVLDGGKRLRPMLVLASAQAVASGQVNQSASMGRCALRAACAVELIHAYSLVHDDMPCMDNDLLRRGKPTVHVQFGQAMALLAGDALQALAFELLTPACEEVPAVLQASLCAQLARASGCTGMAGGQAIDLASVGLSLSEAQLQEMHRLKTGALLQASVMMGASCAQLGEPARMALSDYGAAIGLAFQVVDDILDVTADAATLGKTPGKDAQDNKPTYVSLMGLDRARAYAQTLYEQAIAALARSGLPDTRALAGLAEMVVARHA